MTDKQKNIKIGVTILGIELTAYSVYKFKESWKLDQLANKRKQLVEGVGSGSKISKTITLSNTIVKILKVVNPNFKTDKGYQINCENCSTTYEMRHRGLTHKC